MEIREFTQMVLSDNPQLNNYNILKSAWDISVCVGGYKHNKSVKPSRQYDSLQVPKIYATRIFQRSLLKIYAIINLLPL